MAGNTRGKIKEHLEGCHRNFDWANVHLEKTTELIDGHKPQLSDGIKSLQTAVCELDGLLMAVYAQI